MLSASLYVDYERFGGQEVARAKRSSHRNFEPSSPDWTHDNNDRNEDEGALDTGTTKV